MLNRQRLGESMPKAPYHVIYENGVWCIIRSRWQLGRYPTWGDAIAAVINTANTPRLLSRNVRRSEILKDSEQATEASRPPNQRLIPATEINKRHERAAVRDRLRQLASQRH